MPFINNPNSSRDLIISMISFISSLEIINVILPDSNIFLWIVTSDAEATFVNPNVIETLLANTFPIKGNPLFSNGPRSLPKSLILCDWVFDNFILAKELFSKVLWIF